MDNNTNTNTNINTNTNKNFIAKLKANYGHLERSRLAKHRETDSDSLGYFERILNESLPQNEAENDLKDAMRDLYHADKTALCQCFVREPAYVLLTEARAIVLHFGIQDIIYIEWTGEKFHVTENDREPSSYDRTGTLPRASNIMRDKRDDRHLQKRRGGKKYGMIRELHERIEKLEAGIAVPPETPKSTITESTAESVVQEWNDEKE